MNYNNRIILRFRLTELFRNLTLLSLNKGKPPETGKNFIYEKGTTRRLQLAARFGEQVHHLFTTSPDIFTTADEKLKIIIWPVFS